MGLKKFASHDDEEENSKKSGFTKSAIFSQVMLKLKNDVKSMGLTSFPEASQRKKSLSDHSCPILVSMMHIMSLREERENP